MQFDYLKFVKIIFNKMNSKQFFFQTFRSLPFKSVLIIPFLLLAFILQGVSQPPKAKPWIAPVSANQLKNPLAGNVSVLKDAKKNYEMYCTACHGAGGKGDGAAAATLNPKPADHTSSKVQSQSDGALFWKLSEGRGTMASYKQILTDDKQRWALVNYIRTLKKK